MHSKGFGGSGLPRLLLSQPRGKDYSMEQVMRIRSVGAEYCCTIHGTMYNCITTLSFFKGPPPSGLRFRVLGL